MERAREQLQNVFCHKERVFNSTQGSALAVTIHTSLYKLSNILQLWTRVQRESFFDSRDENESFSDSISHIETRPRISDT